ncbi:MAG: type IV toxin-antitoxin system AbiEi family antitoxin domain-containing protein [Gordonibacter sp.]|uniref:type IV toxin-antitoxin system AbiEi family antitoxin domain-containing protein n=1 Tax=Gordonibacter sp. TaxID=1968902 RepID=UPI002FC87168
MTYYDDIYEIAVDNYGLITSAEAKELGVSDQDMSMLAKRGRLEKRGHGVYKLTRYVPTPYDAYAEAVVLVGPHAYLYGESVIAMLELAPTNPSRVFIATPSRIRKQLPEYIVLVKTDGAITHYENIPSQSAYDAIRACRETMMPERLEDATREATRQGYITNKQATELLEELE